jgi:hypothetical protein
LDFGAGCRMFQLFGVLGKSSAWKKILLLTLNFESCGVVEEGGYTTSIFKQ